ncbi:hypothetical protein M758_5G050300 [Ceratodon purpureus]|nr:hypothetical protein M758_5G050300 [Ceratodon purpureus]
MPRSPAAALLRIVPKKIQEGELQPGDHICTDRNLTSYYHHGIYMGKNRVIHFSKVSESNPPGELDKCHHGEDTTKDEPWGVRKCCLECFVRRKPGWSIHPHSLYIIKYGKRLTPVSLIDSGASHRKALPAEEVLRNAAEMLDNEKLKHEMLEKGEKGEYEKLVSEEPEKKCFGTYYLVLKNCETFAFYCKTGIRYGFGSKQILLAAVQVVFKIFTGLSR